jgi:hypothetical protein
MEIGDWVMCVDNSISNCGVRLVKHGIYKIRSFRVPSGGVRLEDVKLSDLQLVNRREERAWNKSRFIRLNDILSKEHQI